MPELVLYHRTTIAEARQIAKRGFRDQKWGFMLESTVTGQQLKVIGVWLTDHVLADYEGPPGDAVMEVTLDGSEQDIAPFAVAGVLESGSLWLIPAAYLNARAHSRIHSVDPRTSFWYDRDQLGEDLDE